MINNERIISNTKTVKEAISKIDKLLGGEVFVVDHTNKVFGSLSDGDIRRYMLNGGDLNKSCSAPCNPDYTYIKRNKPLNRVMNELYSKGINFVPLLNDDGSLSDLLDITSFLHKSFVKKVVSRAPARVALAGGGSDKPEYLEKNLGCSVNFTVKKYAWCEIFLSDLKHFIEIKSCDLGTNISFSSLEELNNYQGEFRLIVEVIKFFKIKFPLRMVIKCDWNIGSGLGGSSALVVAVIQAMAKISNISYTRYELAEIAFQIERLAASVYGGWQDQYATVFGGVNYMEFSKDENVISQLRISQKMKSFFEMYGFLVDTMRPHDSGEIHMIQSQEINEEIRQNSVKKSVIFAKKLKKALEKDDFNEVLSCVNGAWNEKKKISSAISNDFLNSFYNKIIGLGAMAGKLLGAGGGGCFIFFAPIEKRQDIENFLISESLKSENLLFEEEGSIVLEQS